MTEHTPTPWNLHKQPYEFRSGEGLDYSLMSNNDVLVLMAAPGHVTRTFEANADFIVRAVNARDDLVKELEEILEFTLVEKQVLGEQEIASVRRILAKAKAVQP